MRGRRDNRVWLVGLMVFVAVALFMFLMQKFKGAGEVEAANLSNFDAGYIISDYQMSNYGSMSEAQIQSFLKSKNACNDTNLNRAGVGDKVGHYSESSPMTWHVANGHFVCMADESINGESAAHIIWQAAQDYKINPQVLIVLLQKEQGLITDTFPHSIQYRSATGYGCPDTAACSSKYYGLKNQIRNAAAMFRTVLDGGWTNYPVGNNYIQYNPNAACGGSVVNIRNRATSALYRYTPYQPNAGALAAGYGTASCGAYGNRNFYLYFEDWFGGIAMEASYVRLESPRYMELMKETERINPYTGEVVDVLPEGMIRKYDSKIRMSSGEWCLRTEFSTANNADACVKLGDLKEIKFKYEPIPISEQKKVIVNGAKKTGIRYGVDSVISKFIIRNFTKKTTFQGVTYYITEFDDKYSSAEYGVSEEYLRPAYKDFGTTKGYVLKNTAQRIDPYSGEVYDELEKGRAIVFAAEMVVDGVKYYQTKNNLDNNINAAIRADNLVSFEDYGYEEFLYPREMVISKRVDRINPYTGEKYDTLDAGRVIKFTTKVYLNGQWYYRTEHNTNNNINAAIPASSVREK